MDLLDSRFSLSTSESSVTSDSCSLCSSGHRRVTELKLQWSEDELPHSDNKQRLSDEKKSGLPQQKSGGRRCKRYWSRPTRATVKRNFVNRCLSRKAVLSLLVLCFLGKFAFSELVQSQVVNYMFKGILKEDSELFNAVSHNALQVLGFLFYPLGGVLADVYLGRHRSARVCLLLIWGASGLLALSTAIGNNLSGSAESVHILKDIFHTWLPLACFLLYSIASGIFEITVLVLGGDLLLDACSDKVSSFIYWYYWTDHFAKFLTSLVNLVVEALKPLDKQFKGVSFVPVIHPMLSVAILTVAIVFDTCTSTLYDAEHKNTNPVRLVCGVIYNSRQWRQPPPFRSAFRYGEDPPSGLDYARQHHGGKYTDEEVEDVRTFGWIMVFLLSLSGFMIVYSAVDSMQSYQIASCANFASHTNSTASQVEVSSEVAEILRNVESRLSLIFVIILIPIFNNLIIPIVGQYMPNMKKMIGLGIIVILLASVTMLLLELNVNQSQTTRMAWFILPIFLVSLSDMATSIPMLEFVYAQSPDNMKSLLTGFYFFLFGFWYALVEVAVYFFTAKISTIDNCSTRILSPSTNATLWYYTGVTVIGGGLCIVLYFIVAYKYKNRTRNNPISDIMRVNMYYH